MHVGLKVIKSEQERKDNSRMLEPEPRKCLIRMQTREERTARLELDSSLVNRFEVRSVTSLARKLLVIFVSPEIS